MNHDKRFESVMSAVHLGNPKFPLGRIMVTRAVHDEIGPREIFKALVRHVQGDWGELKPEDKLENELSLQAKLRLFSVYKTAKGRKFWIITEADRTSTIVLFPEDY